MFCTISGSEDSNSHANSPSLSLPSSTQYVAARFSELYVGQICIIHMNSHVFTKTVVIFSKPAPNTWTNEGASCPIIARCHANANCCVLCPFHSFCPPKATFIHFVRWLLTASSRSRPNASSESVGRPFCSLPRAEKCLWL